MHATNNPPSEDDHRTISLMACLVFLSLILGFAEVHHWGRFNTPPIRSDGAGYYAYLVDAFIYQDMTSQRLVEDLLAGDSAAAKTYGLERLSDRNGYLIKYPVGVALLESPFFMGAHLSCRLIKGECNGHSALYQNSVGVAAAFYCVSGLLLTYGVLRRRFGSATAYSATLACVFATNLYHYATYDASFSHVYSFFAVSSFVYLTDRFITHPRPMLAIALGLSAALTCLTRLSDVMVIPLVALALISDGASELRRKLAGRYETLLAVGLAFLGTILLQLIYWHQSTGTWLIGNSYIGEPGFKFASPNFPAVLFLPTKGLFLWQPVLILACLGLLRAAFATGDRLSLAGLGIFGIAAYIYAAWWTPTLGGGFGHRGFVDFYLFAALGLAAAFEAVKGTRLRLPFWGALVLLGFINTHRMVQYWKGTVPSAGFETWSEYWATAFLL